MSDEMRKEKVSVDSDVKQIVEWDKAKVVLMFDTKPGRFKILEEEVLKNLSTRNRERYYASLEAHRDREAEAPVAATIAGVEVSVPPALEKATGGFKVNPEAGSAVKRLAFTPAPGTNREDYGFHRPEDVQDRLDDGYVLAPAGTKSRSRADGSAGIHKITRAGQDELVLLYKPDALRALDQQVKNQSASLSAANEGGMASAARDLPGQPKDVSAYLRDADFSKVE